METCFDILGCPNNAESQSPCGCFEAFRGGFDGVFVLRHFGSQSFDCGGVVRFILALRPFGIGISSRWFAGEFEPAFGLAFDIGLKKR